MLRQYRQQRQRLDLLPRYRAIVTHSTHMQKEYVNHGLNAERVFNVRYGPDAQPIRGSGRGQTGAGPRSDPSAEPWRLLFVGRMDQLKGGRELLQALPSVAARLDRDVHLTFAGDGELRSSWEAIASHLQQDDPRLQIHFTGWVGRAVVDSLCAQSDLLVLPSLWPEPLALVGLEAARHCLPVAAFDVGGISDWLTSGQNGFLAPGDPPSVAGLANAIVACLENPQMLARLREGAGRLSADFAFDRHVELLLRAFTEAAAIRH
jgi:glycosyltransferase involved in cell wall biosynthesis